MTTDFKSWISGSIFIVMLATFLFLLQWLINDTIYISWFEWYGVLMAFFSIVSGVSLYKQENASKSVKDNSSDI